MEDLPSTPVLDRIRVPSDLRLLSLTDLQRLAEEIRRFLLVTVSRTGGHLGPNLGVVELTLALHRVFDSPRDRILWDTGHQAYVHKLLTRPKEGFARLRKLGGMSGYPNRAVRVVAERAAVPVRRKDVLRPVPVPLGQGDVDEHPARQHHLRLAAAQHSRRLVDRDQRARTRRLRRQRRTRQVEVVRHLRGQEVLLVVQRQLETVRQQVAILRDAQLGADLRDADLRSADVTGAEIGDDLRGAKWQDARYNATTRWPQGFDPRKHGAIPTP